MKKFLSALLLLFAVTGAQAQLLWKISGKGLAKPSYVVGTYHLAPVSFADSIPGLEAALDNTEQVYGELDMRQLSDAAQLTKLQTAMMLPEGKTLSSLLTKEQKERLNAVMLELLGADMNNPMLAQQMEKVSPAALMQQLVLVMYMKKHPGFAPRKLFDGYFQSVAAEKGKPIGGLETVDFQVEVLFGGTTLERQVEQLMCLVDDREYNEQNMNLILEGFFGQDLQKIEKALNEKRNNSCDSTPEEDNRLIYSRNADWAKRLPDIMKEKSTFLAVGVGHLPGQRGLLELLRKAGYDVTPVK